MKNNREEIKSYLKNLLQSQGFQSNFDEENHIKDLGIDSLSTVNLLIKVESEYNIQFDDKFLQKTMKEFIDAIINQIDNV